MSKRKATPKKVALAFQVILKAIKRQGFPLSDFTKKEITDWAHKLANELTFRQLRGH